MKLLSTEEMYAMDVLRFLSMSREDQLELLAGPGAPDWISTQHPLRGALEELGEHATFLFDPDCETHPVGEQAVRELEALVEILLWADDHHPSGKIYTSFPAALDREEWSLIRRLAGNAIDGFGQQRAPFQGDWRMIFAN